MKDCFLIDPKKIPKFDIFKDEKLRKALDKEEMQMMQGDEGTVFYKTIKGKIYVFEIRLRNNKGI